MRKRTKKPKSRSGPTLAQSERGARVCSFSLPDESRELVDRLAVKHGTTKSAIIVLALGALVQAEGAP